MNLTLRCGCECVILIHGRGDSPLPWGEITQPCRRHDHPQSSPSASLRVRDIVTEWQRSALTSAQNCATVTSGPLYSAMAAAYTRVLSLLNGENQERHDAEMG